MNIKASGVTELVPTRRSFNRRVRTPNPGPQRTELVQAPARERVPAALDPDERQKRKVAHFLRKYRRHFGRQRDWKAVAARAVIRAFNGNVKLSLQVICELLSVSPRNLERLFLKRFGQTIEHVRQEQRFAYAQSRLLLAQPGKISAIAEACGYSSASDFTFFFRKQAGMTPSQFRALRLESVTSVEHVVG